MKYKATHAGFGLALSLLCTTIHAGTWQLGIVAENSRSPFIDDEEETTVLPEISFIGDRFRYLGGEIEYSLRPGNGSDIYLMGQFRQRQYYSSRLDFDDDLGIEGMDDRDPALEMGLGLREQVAWGQYELEGLFDVSSAYEGYELTARYSYPKQTGRWLIEPAIGLQLQSSDLVDYYHGVRESEAQDGRPAYEADQAINVFASLAVGYLINAELLAVAEVELLALDTSITDSPIVEEEQVRKVCLGLIYTF